jgi:hypothetical protein
METEMNESRTFSQLILPAAVGAAILTLSSAAHAQDASRITAVTLYPGSATIERTARVEPGMTLLRISGLPANFDPQSVRVEADPGVAIGEVSTQDASRVQSPNSREAQLEERIRRSRTGRAASTARRNPPRWSPSSCLAWARPARSPRRSRTRNRWVRWSS